jgi:hypothetical protein
MSAMRLTSGVLLVCALVALPHSGPLAAGAEAQRTRAPFVLEDATIASVHAAFAARTLTCRALVDQYLARISAYDQAGPALNAIVVVNPDARGTSYSCW